MYWPTVKIPNGWNCVEATPSAKDQSWHHEEDEKKKRYYNQLQHQQHPTHHTRQKLWWIRNIHACMHANIRMDMCRCQKQVANTPTTGQCRYRICTAGFWLIMLPIGLVCPSHHFGRWLKVQHPKVPTSTSSIRIRRRMAHRGRNACSFQGLYREVFSLAGVLTTG